MLCGTLPLIFVYRLVENFAIVQGKYIGISIIELDLAFAVFD
jgi:hypothetical protein